MKLFRKLNGYILRYAPDHPHSFTSGFAGRNGHVGYVYEHILVAEREIGRPLRKGEEVHHLDLDRSNNCPSNVIVIMGSEHRKLHHYLESIGIGEAEKSHLEYSYTKIARCKCCKFPLPHHLSITCSEVCYKKYRRKQQRAIDATRPTKVQMKKLIAKHSWVAIGKKLGLSDNGARKYARRIGAL